MLSASGSSELRSDSDQGLSDPISEEDTTIEPAQQVSLFFGANAYPQPTTRAHYDLETTNCQTHFDCEDGATLETAQVWH